MDSVSADSTTDNRLARTNGQIEGKKADAARCLDVIAHTNPTGYVGNIMSGSNAMAIL
jgi:hypothetical protein